MLTDFYAPQYWERNLYGTQDYIQPVDVTDGFLIGQDLHSSLSTTFGTASAFFNGSVNNDNQGINYFIDASYGTSFAAFGGTFVGAHARGTASSPSQTLAGDFLTTYSGAAFGTTTWVTSGATHLLQGLYITASQDATTSVEKDIWIGGVITRMIGWESDTDAIKLNEALLDSDVTIYSSTGAAVSVDGATGDVLFGGDIEVANSSDGLILESPDTTRWRITVDNSGSLVTTSI